MELYQLEYFRILCKYGNFTSASEELMVTQPAVSMAVKKLEEEYGIELIDRDNKAFSLTQAGETVLKHAIAIHNEVTCMRDSLNASYFKKREVIRLALPITMCPALLPELLANYVVQNKAVTLNLLQKGHIAIAKGLADRSIDVGICDKGNLLPVLEHEEYTRVEIFAAFSDDHRFNQCEYVTPEMLNEETLIFSKVSNNIPEYIRSYLEEHKVDAKRKYHDGFPDGNVHLAHRGQGVAFAPKHIAGENSIPLNPPLYCDLVVAWNGKNALTQEQKGIIDFLIGEAEYF